MLNNVYVEEWDFAVRTEFQCWLCCVILGKLTFWSFMLPMTLEDHTLLLPPKSLLTVFAVLRAAPNCSVIFFCSWLKQSVFLFLVMEGRGSVLHSTFSLFPLYTALVFRSAPRNLTLGPSARPCRSSAPFLGSSHTAYLLVPGKDSYPSQGCC